MSNDFDPSEAFVYACKVLELLGDRTLKVEATDGFERKAPAFPPENPHQNPWAIKPEDVASAARRRAELDREFWGTDI